MRTVAILGSTGTIGVNTLDVIARNPDRFCVFALSAHRNWQELLDQAVRFQPRCVVLSDPAAGLQARSQARERGLDVEILIGPDALAEIAQASEIDTVMAAIVGAAGLKPALAAAQSGKRLLLANKEALVMSGRLLMDAAKGSGAQLLPVDSEHNAVFQALPRDMPGGFAGSGVRKVTLTASGGPFRGWTRERLSQVTPEQACRHPNWVMGRKISVDSATMMNKGLELIEACWLFAAEPEQIEILLHPESIIHAMVTYRDGSVLAQMSCPDMRTPIAHALAYPERVAAGVPDLDLASLGKLSFERLDRDQYPCVDLAYAAMAQGGTATAMLNAANEVAVEAFLAGRLAFLSIADLIAAVLDDCSVTAVNSLEDVIAADAQARRSASCWLEDWGHPRERRATSH